MTDIEFTFKTPDVIKKENIFALISNEQILTIELPQSVDLLINDTPPAISGSSATNRTKTAMYPRMKPKLMPKLIGIDGAKGTAYFPDPFFNRLGDHPAAPGAGVS